MAPISAPVPDSAAASHRTCGNAPVPVALPGRPKYAVLAGVSGTSVLEPSTEMTRSPQQNTPGACRAPTGPATKSMCSGSAPNRARARASEEMFGTRHDRPPPACTHPSGSQCPSSSSNSARRRWYKPSTSLPSTCP